MSYLSKKTVERLEQVIRVLQGVKQKQFDMRVWKHENSCGTVACAVGHCMTDPWFNKRGLRVGFIRFTDMTAHEPTFKGKGNFDAVEMFFQLDNRDALYLFSSSEYRAQYREGKPVTPKDVIKRIRDFIDSDGQQHL